MVFFQKKEVVSQIKDKKEIRSVFQEFVEHGKDVLVRFENKDKIRMSVIGEEPGLFFLELDDFKRKQKGIKIDDKISIKLIFEGKSYSCISNVHGFGSFEGIHGMAVKQPEYLNREDKHNLAKLQIIPPIEILYTTTKMDPIEGKLVGIGFEGLEIVGVKDRVSENLIIGRTTFIEVTLPKGGPHLKYECNVEYIERKMVAGCKYLKASLEDRHAIKKWILEEEERKRKKRISNLKPKVSKAKKSKQELTETKSFEEKVETLCDNENYWLACGIPDDLISHLTNTLKRSFGLMKIDKLPNEELPETVMGILIYISKKEDFDQYPINLSDKLNIPVAYIGPANEELKSWRNEAMLHGGLDCINSEPFSSLKTFQACKNSYELFYGHSFWPTIFNKFFIYLKSQRTIL